jgi:CTP:molybdopterin cytidylyltransferase MocA
MSAARIIESMGVCVSLVDGKVKLTGLDQLDRGTVARVLEVARSRKTEIVEELRGKAEASPVPPDTKALEALVRFERNPRGVVAWLADPVKHASRDPAHSARWRACIVEEARLRVADAEAREAQS